MTSVHEGRIVTWDWVAPGLLDTKTEPEAVLILVLGLNGWGERDTNATEFNGLQQWYNTIRHSVANIWSNEDAPGLRCPGLALQKQHNPEPTLR